MVTRKLWLPFLSTFLTQYWSTRCNEWEKWGEKRIRGERDAEKNCQLTSKETNSFMWPQPVSNLITSAFQMKVNSGFGLLFKWNSTLDSDCFPFTFRFFNESSSLSLRGSEEFRKWTYSMGVREEREGEKVWVRSSLTQKVKEMIRLWTFMIWFEVNKRWVGEKEFQYGRMVEISGPWNSIFSCAM